MSTEQETLKTFTCFLFESPRRWKVTDVDLPVNRTISKHVNRVNEALLEEGFSVDLSSIVLYKPLQSLKITTAKTVQWQQSIDFGNPKAFKMIRRQVLSAEFDDEALNLQDTVHLVVVAARKAVVLNYLLFDANDSFRCVQLSGSRNIEDCSQQIAKELQNKKVIADLKFVQLYKAPTDLSAAIAKTDEGRAIIGDLTRLKLLLPSRALHESFSTEELDNFNALHLIVVAHLSKPTAVSSETEETDLVTPLKDFCGTRYRKFYRAYTEGAKTPSTAAQSTEFREIQCGQVPIYDGQRAPGASSTVAMPPSLYHPVFQRWKKKAFDLSIEPPPGVVKAVAELMRKATILYGNEYERSKALNGPLQQVLGWQIESILNTDRTRADERITFLLKRGNTTYNVPLLIDEKNEVGEGSDATIQATFATIRTWTDHKLDNLRNLTCCPTFLLGFSGCQLTIAAVVLTDKCIVERLATLWIGRSSTFDLDCIVNTARVFHALSSALEELKGWYQSEAIVNRQLYDPDTNRPYNHPRFFPHADQYPVDGKDFRHAVKFEYLYPLETSSLCITFLAQATANPFDTFVVKFPQRYCPELHFLLAERGMAPALRYCGKIDENTPYGNWQMVVMDYFEGSQATEEQPTRNAVEEAVEVGHAAGFVFGDMRRANVLVGKADGKVKLIDFDWAGVAGSARYPPDISDNNDLWVDGMTPMALIEKKHDLAMIEKWFPN